MAGVGLRGSSVEWLRLDRSRKLRLAAGAGLALAQSGVLLLVPLAAGRFAERLISDGTGAALGDASFAGAFVALFALLAVARYWSHILIGETEAAVARELRDRVYARLQSLPLRWFHRKPLGDVLAIAALDVETLASFATRLPVAVAPAGLTLLGALVLMARIEPRVALLAAAILPAAQLLIWLLGRSLLARARDLADAHGALMSAVEENLEHLLTIKTFARERAEEERVREASRSLLAHRNGQLRAELRLTGIAQVVSASGAVAIVALAALGTAGTALAPGALVSLLLYGILLARPVTTLAQIHTQRQQARAARDRIETVLCEAPEPVEEPPVFRRDVRGAIEFRGVHFGYPGRPPILCDLDLRIEPGEFVALVGCNGAGKTTLIQLLLRLREGWRGAIRLDGDDVRGWNLSELRRRIGLAPQRTQLFHRSIRENVAFARPGASERQVAEALERAGARELLASLPAGAETRVGERGIELSGGERQRIALARALLAEPPVLILDEAMSMLDPEGERAFLERNCDWLRQRTVLLVTHRPSSLPRADRVVAVRAGQALTRALPDALELARPARDERRRDRGAAIRAARPPHRRDAPRPDSP